MYLTYSPASAAFPSDSNEPECAPSHSAKSIHTAALSSPNAGLAHRSTTTFDLFPESAESTLSAAECHASRQALLANDWEAPTNDGYGQPSLKLFEYLAPVGSWQRTLSESLASSLTGLTGSAGNW